MSIAQLRVAANDAVEHDVDIAAIGERASRLGIEIADIVGIIEDLGGLGRAQLDTLRDVVRSARETNAANSKLAASMEEARASASQTRAVLSTATRRTEPGT